MCGLEAYKDAIVGSLGVEMKKRTTIGVELAAKVRAFLAFSQLVAERLVYSQSCFYSWMNRHLGWIRRARGRSSRSYGTLQIAGKRFSARTFIFLTATRDP